MSIIEQNSYSKFLRISNTHSINPSDTNSSFHVNLNRMLDTDDIIRCVVKSVSFPNNQYNITSDNNGLDFEAITPGNETHTAVLDVGYYTVSQLMVEMKAKIDALLPSGTIAFTLNPTTYKIDYTVTGYTSIQFFATSTVGKSIGLLVDTAVAASSTFDSIPYLYGLTNVYVHSTAVGENNLVDGDVENHDIIAEIPVNVPFGELVHYQSNDDELDSINYRSLRNFNNVKIELKDLDNNLLKLNQGDVVILLKLYYV